MSHMLDSHYLFGLSPAILKHRIFSFSVSSSSLQLSLKTLVYRSPWSYLHSLFYESPHSRDLHVLAPRLVRRINTIFCTPRPFDRPSVATEIAWYPESISLFRGLSVFFDRSPRVVQGGVINPPFSPVIPRSLDFFEPPYHFSNLRHAVFHFERALHHPVAGNDIIGLAMALWRTIGWFLG